MLGGIQDGQTIEGALGSLLEGRPADDEPPAADLSALVEAFATWAGWTRPLAAPTPADAAPGIDWTGTRADERRVGTADADILNGRGGDDRLIGRAGNDQLLGGAGEDTLKGNAGHDRLLGGGGADDLIGGAGRDVLLGRGGNDDLRGGSGDDELAGGNGNDVLRGGRGADTLWGGAGNDRLFDGKGRDVLIGNAGRDVFVFDGDVSGGNDRIEVRLADNDHIRMVNFGAIQFRVVQQSADTYVAEVEDRRLTIHFDTAAALDDALALF